MIDRTVDVIDLSLERIRRVLFLLENPQDACPPVIHVAGTNGKGSTIAFMRAMLEAEGYVVHVYTSPHLIAVEERFVVAGKQVSADVLQAVQAEVRALCAKNYLNLTPFEALTVCAFLLFSRFSADYVLLETGLGGRLDATNVVACPALTVLTKISLDHEEFLGSTLEKIALEKIGILRKNVPVVVAPQADSLCHFMRKEILERGALLNQAGMEWRLDRTADGGGQVTTQTDKLFLPKPGLLGAHQLENAATAAVAMQCLGVKYETIQEGVCRAWWPGRFQKLDWPGLQNDVELWVDGAHNQDGLMALALQIKAWKKEDERPVVLVGNMLKNRDPALLIQVANAVADKFVALNMEDNRFHNASIFKASEIISIKGIDVYLKNRNNPCRIVVTGSLYLVGMVLYFWKKVLK